MTNRSTDRPLDVARATRAVCEQFPEFYGLEVAPYGSGWDNELFSFGKDRVFRFPKRAEVVEWIVREIALMPLVGEALGALVPRFDYVGQPSVEFPTPSSDTSPCLASVPTRSS